jgi:hypothetical protein
VHGCHWELLNGKIRRRKSTHLSRITDDSSYATVHVIAPRNSLKKQRQMPRFRLFELADETMRVALEASEDNFNRCNKIRPYAEYPVYNTRFRKNSAARRQPAFGWDKSVMARAFMVALLK